MGAVVAVVAIYYLVISSQNATLAEVQLKAQKEGDRATSAEKTAKRAQEIENELQEKNERLAAIEATMANGDIYFWGVTLINNFRKKHPGIEAPNIPKPTEGEIGLLPNFPYKAMTLSVGGAGFYSDIGRFIADFENTYPFIRVMNVELNPVVTGGGENEKASDKEKLAFKFDIVSLIKPGAVR